MRLATSHGARVGRQALDAQILDDESAACEAHAEPADVHRPVEPARALRARPAPQRGPRSMVTVETSAGADHNGHDDDDAHGRDGRWS